MIMRVLLTDHADVVAAMLLMRLRCHFSCMDAISVHRLDFRCSLSAPAYGAAMATWQPQQCCTACFGFRRWCSILQKRCAAQPERCHVAGAWCMDQHGCATRAELFWNTRCYGMQAQCCAARVILQNRGAAQPASACARSILQEGGAAQPASACACTDR